MMNGAFQQNIQAQGQPHSVYHQNQFQRNGDQGPFPQSFGPSTNQQVSTNSSQSGAPLPNINGTEVHLNSLKICFKQAANSITQLYKQSSFSYNIAYQQGRQDAYEEVLQWFLDSANANGADQLKNVSKKDFYDFIQLKLSRQKVDCGKAHDENQAFLSQLMPPPPNRAPSAFAEPSASRMDMSHYQQASNQELLEMAANQAVMDEASTNGGFEVIRNVNSNFGVLKMNESKKRNRPTGQMMFHQNQIGQPSAAGGPHAALSFEMHQSFGQGVAGHSQFQIDNTSQLASTSIADDSGSNVQMSSSGDQATDYTKKIYKAKRFKPQQQ